MNEKELWMEFANALERASELAKEIAESEETHIELKADEEIARKAFRLASRDNRIGRAPLNVD